jgi:hypothetical protein
VLLKSIRNAAKGLLLPGLLLGLAGSLPAEIGEISVDAGPPATRPAPPDRSALWVNAGTRVTILLKDQRGRRVGIDAARKIVKEVPHSRSEVDYIENRYTGDPDAEAMQRIEIEPAAQAVYTIFVKGLQPGPFELDVAARGKNGSSQPSKQLGGLISEGEEKIFTLTFDPDSQRLFSVVEGAGLTKK